MAQPIDKIRSAYLVKKPNTPGKFGQNASEPKQLPGNLPTELASNEELLAAKNESSVKSAFSTRTPKDSSFLVDSFNWTLNILIFLGLFMIFTQINRKYWVISFVSNRFREVLSENTSVKSTAASGVQLLEVIQNTTEKAIEPLKSTEAKEKMSKLEEHINKEIGKMKAITAKPKRGRDLETVHESQP